MTVFEFFPAPTWARRVTADIFENGFVGADIQAFFRHNVQADQRTFEFQGASVFKKTKLADSSEIRESSAKKKGTQELLIQSDNMVIVLVNVPPENHAHDKKSFLCRMSVPG